MAVGIVEKPGLWTIINVIVTGILLVINFALWYFNRKNERTGVLFESKFKAIFIEENNYLVHLSRYIHLNPVELMCDFKNNAKTRNNGFNWKSINKSLERYRWSSYLDYIGKHNFPSVINKSIINNYFNTIIREKMYQMHSHRTCTT